MGPTHLKVIRQDIVGMLRTLPKDDLFGIARLTGMSDLLFWSCFGPVYGKY